MRFSVSLTRAVARAGLPTLVLLASSCGEPPEPREPCPCKRPSASSNLPLPRWSQPDETRPASTALRGPPRETVSIAQPPRRDPVDAVLARSRRRIGNLSLHQAPVDETLKMFASMGRFNVVMPGEVGGRKVSLELRNVSLAGAFRAVLASASLEARVVADDILEVRPAGSKP